MYEDGNVYIPLYTVYVGVLEDVVTGGDDDVVLEIGIPTEIRRFL
jgi:hypothetical protein